MNDQEFLSANDVKKQAASRKNRLSVLDHMQAIKWIDHYVGLPLTVGIGAGLSLLRVFPRKPTPGAVRRILVTKFFGMGSIVLSGELVRSLKRAFPEAELTYVTFKGNGRIAQIALNADSVQFTDTRSVWRFFTSSLRHMTRFARDDYDLSVDLEFYSKYSTLVTLASGASKRAGFYLPAFWRRSLYTHTAFFNHARHILEIYGMLAKACGVTDYEPVIHRLNVPGPGIEDAEAFLRRNGISEGNAVIGVNVNASELALGRRWMPEKFADLISRISRQGTRVIMTGSQEEAAYVEDILKLVPADCRKSVVLAAGHLNLDGFLGLLTKMDVFVTNDSGPMILAFAVGTPTVSIWGPGRPAMYGPRTGIARTIMAEYPCSPCIYLYRTNAGKFCDYKYPCMHAVSVDDVFNLSLIHI